MRDGRLYASENHQEILKVSEPLHGKGSMQPAMLQGHPCPGPNPYPPPPQRSEGRRMVTGEEKVTEGREAESSVSVLLDQEI